MFDQCKRRSRLHNSAAFLASVIVLNSSHNCRAEPQANLSLLRDVQQSLNVTSEYVFRNDSDEMLIPVYLLGAVTKPGLYHIPSRTDLITLMALSGGPTGDAEIEHIFIRSRPEGMGVKTPEKADSSRNTQEINFKRLVSRGNETPPSLASNDVVFVSTKVPAVSSNALLIIGLVSGILTIALSASLIAQTGRAH